MGPISGLVIITHFGELEPRFIDEPREADLSHLEEAAQHDMERGLAAGPELRAAQGQSSSPSVLFAQLLLIGSILTFGHQPSRDLALDLVVRPIRVGRPQRIAKLRDSARNVLAVEIPIDELVIIKLHHACLHVAGRHESCHEVRRKSPSGHAVKQA